MYIHVQICCSLFYRDFSNNQIENIQDMAFDGAGNILEMYVKSLTKILYNITVF
jgi:hypothetical protein